MSKVKRYDFVGSCRRGPTPDGYFVRFSDYAKLETELHSERIQSDRLLACHEQQSEILAALTAERDRLKARIAPCPPCEIGEDSPCTCNDPLVPKPWLDEVVAERDRLREALEKISAAEVWSHGHHVRLDVTTVQEVTVFARAVLAAKGSAGLESMAEPKSAVPGDTPKGNGEGTPPASFKIKKEV